MASQTFKVIPSEAGRRLDVILTDHFGQGRNHWQQLIKSSAVSVDGQVAKPSYLVENGDSIVIILPDNLPNAPVEYHDLPIVYEDAHILAIDKPAGMLVHGVTGRTAEPTVAQFAAARTSDPDPERPGIVHRLDRETSGLVLIAKDADTKQYLQDQFRQRVVHKTYQLLVSGHLKQSEALIDLPIGRKSDSAKRSVLPTGKPAQTSYQVMREYPGFSLVEAHPKTGRTHQLRVHFAHLGHPIAGDRLYGQKPPAGLNRMFLHASKLEFTNLDGQPVILTSPLPPALQKFLETL